MKQVLIYIIYILCTSILAFFIRKKKNIFNYLFLLIIIIIIWSTYTLVWSYEIIGDRLNYVMWFQRIYPIYSNNLNLIFQQNNEYGWVFLILYYAV